MPLYKAIKNKKATTIPGMIVQCKSGRFVAFYDHRSDIIANGSNEREAKKNLKEMYEAVMKYEEDEEKKTAPALPKDFKVRAFKEKIPAI